MLMLNDFLQHCYNVEATHRAETAFPSHLQWHIDISEFLGRRQWSGTVATSLIGPLKFQWGLC